MKLDLKSLIIGALSVVCLVLLIGAKDAQYHTHDSSDIYGVAEENHDHYSSDIYGVAEESHDHDGYYAEESHDHYSYDLYGVAKKNHNHGEYADIYHSHY